MSEDEKEDLIEQAPWALIDHDTDVAARGVRDAHYRDRRADVERILPILCREHVKTDNDKILAEIREWRTRNDVEGNLPDWVANVLAEMLDSDEPHDEVSEWEYGWAGDAQATTWYSSREEAEEFMREPLHFRRRKAGPWEPVSNA